VRRIRRAGCLAHFPRLVINGLVRLLSASTLFFISLYRLAAVTAASPS
jgi:hypothetical protein